MPGGEIRAGDTIYAGPICAPQGAWPPPAGGGRPGEDLSRQAWPGPGGQSISFTIKAGQWLGLVGEPGSGKSTTSEIIVRRRDPISGALLFDGQDIAATPAARFMKHPQRREHRDGVPGRDRSGVPWNGERTSRRARLLRETATAPRYRLTGVPAGRPPVPVSCASGRAWRSRWSFGRCRVRHTVTFLPESPRPCRSARSRLRTAPRHMEPFWKRPAYRGRRTSRISVAGAPIWPRP